jgi:hypothetical protein
MTPPKGMIPTTPKAWTATEHKMISSWDHYQVKTHIFDLHDNKASCFLKTWMMWTANHLCFLKSTWYLVAMCTLVLSKGIKHTPSKHETKLFNIFLTDPLLCFISCSFFIRPLMPYLVTTQLKHLNSMLVSSEIMQQLHFLLSARNE